MQKEITITGHRGASGIETENTLSGISKALKINGINRIEVDVQQTKDGVVVLMHDLSIDRTTSGKGEIIKYTYNELQKYDIILKDGTREKIPTLEDAFKLFDGSIEFLIEIKHGKEKYSGIEKKVVDLIEQYNAKDWCIIQSFKDNVLKEVNSIYPEIRLHKLLFLGTFYNFDKLDFIEEYSIYYKLLSKGMIRKIHKHNKKVNVWTVNKKSSIEKQINRGVDGVISDFPESVYDIIEKKNKEENSLQQSVKWQ